MPTVLPDDGRPADRCQKPLATSPLLQLLAMPTVLLADIRPADPIREPLARGAVMEVLAP